MLTNLTQVQDQIQKYWAPRFTGELRESLLLGGLVNKEYEGEIKKGGDTVRVSQLAAPSAELLNVGVNADSFNSDQITMTKVDIVADKRAVASYKVADLVDLQSQLDQQNPEILTSLQYAVAKKVNDYLYSLVSPSTSAPDHDLASTATFDATAFQSIRKLAGEAKWPQDGSWYLLQSPKYYADLLNITSLTSTDFGASDAAVVSGQVALKRYGFSILEDNSRTGSYAIAFHPSFMHMVMQREVQIRVSDRHAMGEFGYIISVDMVFGAKLAVDGAVRHIRITN